MVRSNFERERTPLHKDLLYMLPYLMFVWADVALYLCAIKHYGFRTGAISFMLPILFLALLFFGLSAYDWLESKFDEGRAVVIIPPSARWRKAMNGFFAKQL